VSEPVFLDGTFSVLFLVQAVRITSQSILQHFESRALDFLQCSQGIYQNTALIYWTVGPLLGGIILENLDWPWLFWILLIICFVPIVGAFFFLQETYVPVLLAERKKKLEKEQGGKYTYEGEDDRPLKTKLLQSITRPL
jgi:MFS family permease